MKMLVASLIAASASLGAALVRPAPPGVAIRITVGGLPVSAGTEARSQLLGALRRRLYAPLSVEPPGAKRRLSWADLGATVDTGRLASLLGQATDPASAMAQAAARRGGALDLPAPIVLDREASWAALVRWKDEVDRAPCDARVDLGRGKVVAEQPGVLVDLPSTLARLEALAPSLPAQVSMNVGATAPALSAARIGPLKWGKVIGFFETKYATDEKHEARTYNLALAASRLDGHVILPGETFDFNDVVGPRDEASGYKVATVIAQGELVDGVGGGTCQIAGTLHGAALFAGLEIVERKPHTRPSFYIKMGLDAMVLYPAVTLKVRNTYDHPVVLHETVEGGVVRAEILGPEQRRTVTFVRKIDDIAPFPEVERPDPKLPRGSRVVAQRGIPGFAIHRYRITRDGPSAVRERWNDTYPPTAQIVRVGTGDGASGKPTPDAHPEYVADEYLVLMQGPDIDGDGMVEVREPGRSGEYGWTDREGFSHDPARAARAPGSGAADVARSFSPPRASRVGVSSRHDEPQRANGRTRGFR